jgi:hypothetical protein
MGVTTLQWGCESIEAHFLSIWSGKAVRVDRKTDEQFLYIEKPNLSIVGGIQPGTLIRKLRGEHLGNGLAQRFLYRQEIV